MAIDPVDNWTYSRSIAIGDTIVDYQLKLTLYADDSGHDTAPEFDLNGKCSDYPNDIRFGSTSDPATATEYPFWIESTDATKTVVWVKAPNATPIYIFVGRSSTASGSDSSNTFIFFDDFTSLDTEVWDNIGSNTTSIIDGTKLRFTTDENDYVEDTGIVKKTTNNYADVIVEAYLRRYGDTSADNDISINVESGYVSGNDNWRTSANPNLWAWVGDTYAAGAQDSRIRKYTGSSADWTSPTINALTDSYTRVTVQMVSGDGNLTVGESSSTTSNAHPTGLESTFYVAFYINSVDGYGFEIDWTFLRKYVATEPSWGAYGTWTAIEEEAEGKIPHIGPKYKPRTRMGWLAKMRM